MIQSVLDEMKQNIKTLNTLKKHNHKIGALKFCSDVKSINLKQYENTYKIKGYSKVKLQGISGWIKVNGLKQFKNKNFEFANAKILNTPNGYYVAITCFKNKIKEDNIVYKNSIGIDLGCETSITTSDGDKFNCYIEETERLKKLQRKLCKQIKNSNNYRKTCLKIGQQYQYMNNQKQDKANKVVHELLLHEVIYMQDEQLAKWKDNYHGKKVQHSYLGLVKTKLMKNSRVKIIKKYIPTTKLCQCGYIWKDLKESNRILSCPKCGLCEDRDIHAAKMMIIQGQNLNNLKLGQELTKITPADFKQYLKAETGRSHSSECD